jgi:adenylate cyclase
MAHMVDELFDQQKIALLGFDVVFAEADNSSGLAQLNALAHNELKDQAGFTERLRGLQTTLDYDGQFAKSLENRPVVLGYYLNGEGQSRTSGVLPEPVLTADTLQGRTIRSTSWNGYGANIEVLAKAAPTAGFFNSITDRDGVVRSLPLLSEFQGRYYESLALAMFRAIAGSPSVAPGFSNEKFLSRSY